MKKKINEKQRIYGKGDFVIVDADVYTSKPSGLECVTYLECIDPSTGITYVIAKNNVSGKFDIIYNNKIVKIHIFGILSFKTAYDLLYSYFKGSTYKIPNLREETILVDSVVSDFDSNVGTFEIYNANKYRIDSTLQGLNDRLYKKLQIEIFRLNRGQTLMKDIHKMIMKLKPILNSEYNILISSHTKEPIKNITAKIEKVGTTKTNHFILIRRSYDREKNIVIRLV